MRTFRCRRVPSLAVALFVLILASTAIERRLAEIDFDDFCGSTFDNPDTFNGQEILSRLILLNDTVLPEAPSDAGAVVALVPAEEPRQIDGPELSVPGSRAPPVVVL